MKYKVTYNNRQHIVDAATHQQAINKVKTLVDSDPIALELVRKEIEKINRKLKYVFVDLKDKTKNSPVSLVIDWSGSGFTKGNVQLAEQVEKELKQAVDFCKNFVFNGRVIF